MILQAALLVTNIESMKCPECLQKIHDGADCCPQCDWRYSDQFHDFQAGHLVFKNGIYDSSALLGRVLGRLRIEQKIRRIEQKFPYLRVGVAFVSLRLDVSLSRYGVWLLNECTGLGDGEAVILLVDVESSRAMSLMSYGVEKYVKDREAFEVMAAGHPYYLTKEYIEGVERSLKALRGLLRKVSHRSTKY